MERGKELVIPLDEKAMEEIGKQILNHCDFKSIELQERIDKAIEYIKKIKNNRKGLTVIEYKEKWRSMFDYYESEEIVDDLLNILQGKDENK